MILIALGSNRPSAWGAPAAALRHAVKEIAGFPGTRLMRQSRLYETAGVGPGSPGVFINSAVAVECHCGPDALLRRLKMIERRAGSRSARRWGPRALDLDILDYRSRIVAWPGRDGFGDAKLRSSLVLPHPLLHLRPFVLAPLNEIAANWRHPVLRLTARQLWLRVCDEPMGRVLKVL